MTITNLTGLSVQPEANYSGEILEPHAFYVPELTTDEIALIATSELRDGAIVYDKTLEIHKVRQNGAWVNLVTSDSATGAGLTPSSAVILSSGTAVNVQVAANQVNGLVYYDTTSANPKARVGDDWVKLVFSNNDDAGAGLTPSSPLIAPSGTTGNVQVAVNQVNGMIYYDTTANKLAARVNGAWVTITTA